MADNPNMVKVQSSIHTWNHDYNVENTMLMSNEHQLYIYIWADSVKLGYWKKKSDTEFFIYFSYPRSLVFTVIRYCVRNSISSNIKWG